jgi:hypothetical protein
VPIKPLPHKICAFEESNYYIAALLKITDSGKKKTEIVSKKGELERRKGHFAAQIAFVGTNYFVPQMSWQEIHLPTAESPHFI